jgi:hypothetical protein
MRRIAESIQLWFILDDSEEVVAHLDFAQTYLVDYASLVSTGKWNAALLVVKQYDRHVSEASRILRELSRREDMNYGSLHQLFNRVYLQDIEIFQVLSQDRL